jgi:hypothetical protein
MALRGHEIRLAILAAMSGGELSGAGRAASLRHPLSKVPEVTVYFWITKVLTTGMGEATSDYLVHRINPKNRVRSTVSSSAWLATWRCPART